MTFAALLEKLMQLERAIAASEPGAARAMTMEAEEMVLKLDQEAIEGLENKQLRSMMGFGRGSDDGRNNGDQNIRTKKKAAW